MKKKIAVKDADACMNCGTCFVACSTKFHKTTWEDDACIGFGFKKDGTAKLAICTQCGKCAKECPEEAIQPNKFGVYTIDKKKCKNCGKCVEVCPFGLVVPGKETPNKCIVCGACVKACPVDALFIKEIEDK